MNNRVLLVFLLASLLFAPALVSAAPDLTGTWHGTFKGVQVGAPGGSGPFGAWGMPTGRSSKQADGPNFVNATLTITFDVQEDGLAIGSWAADDFGQKFVCALVGQSAWSCEDAGGRADVEVLSANQIKVCYFDRREGAHGAGCAMMQKK